MSAATFTDGIARLLPGQLLVMIVDRMPSRSFMISSRSCGKTISELHRDVFIKAWRLEDRIFVQHTGL